MKTGFVNYLLAALILTIGGCLPALSQNKCNLQIGVYEFKEDGSSEDFPVNDAAMNLVNTETKKSLKASANTEITDGSYELTVSKNGFQKTIERFSVECSLAGEENSFQQIVFLWKGDPKTTFVFPAVTSGMYRESNKAKADATFNTEAAKTEGTTGELNKTKDDAPLNSGAVVLGKPEYPKAALAVRATGTVNVQVTINELGYVVSAHAISGHPLLRAAAVKAAKASKFRMTMLDGIPVRVTGVIVYNFVP